MKKWEYKIVAFFEEETYKNLDDSIIQERMNKLGSEGWELVNFLKYPSWYRETVQRREPGDKRTFYYEGSEAAYFKREI